MTINSPVSPSSSQITSRGYAAKAARAFLEPFSFNRRPLGPTDILIDIKYCGVCHSDLHSVNNDWGGAHYPIVPGHEVVGKVVQVGSAVKNFRVGDNAGVGCMVDSCRECSACSAGEEQYCDEGAVMTYNSVEPHIGGRTYGGYSNNLVVTEDFALKVPAGMELASAAPLLCAGITTYSPLRHWKVGPGMNVGIVGLGGLGHMALKLARSFGAHVVLFTTSPSKVQDALRLGAHEVVLSTDEAAMQERAYSLDFILDTVSAVHDVDALIRLLKHDGTLVMVGLPGKPIAIDTGRLTVERRSLSGSLIGGIKETQEMLDYCASKGIASDIELIPIQKINEAYARLAKGDVKYRFVIDLASLG